MLFGTLHEGHRGLRPCYEKLCGASLRVCSGAKIFLQALGESPRSNMVLADKLGHHFEIGDPEAQFQKQIRLSEVAIQYGLRIGF